MNIYLIGYRCTGKTSVGRVLAEWLRWPLVDTDELVVSRQHRSIRRIVREDGWAEFRRMEKAVLNDVCADGGQVVSTGGGVVLDTGNVALMKRTGRVVLLTARETTILRRMGEDQLSARARPALTAETDIDRDIEREIRQTLVERIPLYEKAMDIRLATDALSPVEIVGKIISAFSLSPA